MKNIIIMLLILLTFSACTTSSLSLNKDKTLHLKYNDEQCIIAQDTFKTDGLNFKDLMVWQYTMIGTEGNTLFGEYAETDLMFEFRHSELSTVMYVFDESDKYEIVYKRNNLTLAQIQMKNKKYVNVLIQANNPQDYYFVYGFSNEEFMKIATTVKVKNTEILAPKFEAIVFDKNDKAQTNWNDMLVYFKPLISPLRGIGGR